MNSRLFLAIPAFVFGFDLAFSRFSFAPIWRLTHDINGSLPAAINGSILASLGLAFLNAIKHTKSSSKEYIGMIAGITAVHLIGGPLFYDKLRKWGMNGEILGALMTAVGAITGIGAISLMKL